VLIKIYLTVSRGGDTIGNNLKGKVFHTAYTKKGFYLMRYWDDEDAYQRWLSSTNIATKLAPPACAVSSNPDLDRESKVHGIEYECYYCKDKFVTHQKYKYERHVITSHPKKLCYPGKVDIAINKVSPQGKFWEV
jgi:hypothetical protein